MTKAKSEQKLREERVKSYKVFKVNEFSKAERHDLVRHQSERSTDASTWWSKRGKNQIRAAGLLAVEASCDWEANLQDAQAEMHRELNPGASAADIAVATGVHSASAEFIAAPEEVRRAVQVPGIPAVFIALVSSHGSMRTAGSECFRNDPQSLERLQSELLRSWSTHKDYAEREYRNHGTIPRAHKGKLGWDGAASQEVSATLQLQHFMEQAMQDVHKSVSMSLSEKTTADVIADLKQVGTHSGLYVAVAFGCCNWRVTVVDAVRCPNSGDWHTVAPLKPCLACLAVRG